ncbi:MAG: DEAD/DEAH box helicase family protein, partial [Leptolyngbyaceae bacterium]|nr:DEAD/DEAH box helicase family protein [Leptolyngbyaceae bacterium]
MTESQTQQDKLHSALKQLIELSAENAKLRAENAILKSKLSKQQQGSLPVGQREASGQILSRKTKLIEESTSMSKAQKIVLFRSLFRGREDVYPTRWENLRSGKSGYSPAIKNKWEYFEAKKQGDKSIAPDYLPITDDVIQQHLEGKIVAGVYPLLNDDTCWFLAVDFDESSFEDDALSFIATCNELSISAYMERSRSCNGAHVWIFFKEPLPAVLARQLGFCILTRTMEKRRQIALKSYDRFFPNQDTLPKGGFGNLIALPLQRKAREKGGSIFVGEKLQPINDQWELLCSIKRISRNLVEKIVNDARRDGNIINVAAPSFDDAETEDPWVLPPSRKRTLKPVQGPFPEIVKVVQSNLIYVDKTGLSPALLNRLRLLAAFQNPEFFKNQAMRLPVYDKPRIIDCSEITGRFLALPRGCFEDVIKLLKDHSIKIELEDHRSEGRPVDLQFNGHLRSSQEEIVGRILKQELALVCAPTAFGKTVVAASVIANRRINTLVLVHRQQLIDQWKDRLQTFLNLPHKSIGQIGAGKKKATGIIDIATIQSLVRQGEVNDIVADYGQVIVDECHHVSAFSFEQVLRGCKAKYVLGLTATPKRKDGHHPIIVMQCGSLLYASADNLNTHEAQFSRSVVVRETGFVAPVGIEKPAIHELYQSLSDNGMRNQMIA